MIRIQNRYKLPASKIPFLPLMFIMLLFLPPLAYTFLKVFGWDGWPGIVVLAILWLLALYVTVQHFRTKRDCLIIDTDGLTLSASGQKIEYIWEDIKKAGFQSVIAKRMGVWEACIYLVLGLSNTSRIGSLKSSPEFGFLQKRSDLTQYLNQSDIFDLYISMRFASKNDSGLLNLLKTKSNFIQKLNPLVKSLNYEEYKKVLDEYFK